MGCSTYSRSILLQLHEERGRRSLVQRAVEVQAQRRPGPHRLTNGGHPASQDARAARLRLSASGRRTRRPRAVGPRRQPTSGSRCPARALTATSTAGGGTRKRTGVARRAPRHRARPLQIGRSSARRTSTIGRWRQPSAQGPPEPRAQASLTVSRSSTAPASARSTPCQRLDAARPGGQPCCPTDRASIAPSWRSCRCRRLAQPRESGVRAQRRATQAGRPPSRPAAVARAHGSGTSSTSRTTSAMRIRSAPAVPGRAASSAAKTSDRRAVPARTALRRRGSPPARTSRSSGSASRRREQWQQHGRSRPRRAGARRRQVGDHQQQARTRPRRPARPAAPPACACRPAVRRRYRAGC